MDLDRFRRLAAGDRLRGQYQVSKQLSTDQEGNKRRAVYMFTAISTKVVPPNFVKAYQRRLLLREVTVWRCLTEVHGVSAKRKEKA